jgi:hypothetical protein
VEPEVGLLLGGEAPDRRSIEGEVVDGLQQELLVVVQHVEPAFEIGEADGDRLQPLLVGQVFDPLLLELVRRDPLHPGLLDLEVQLLELVVGDFEEIAQGRVFHAQIIADRELMSPP